MSRLREILEPCLGFVLFLSLWSVVGVLNKEWGHWFNPMLLPSPLNVLETGIESVRDGSLVRNAVDSLLRVVQGFALAAVVGVALGLLVGTQKIAARLIEPVVELLRPIPPLAFLPMMVLWFGIGELSKVIFIAYAAFFPIFTTTIEGIRFVDPVLIRAARSLGANRRQIFVDVVLKAATPSIITGLRLGFALAFFVIVAAEFIAADSGLGYMINDARTFFDLSQMFLGAIMIGIIGFLINLALRRVENHLLRWRNAQR